MLSNTEKSYGYVARALHWSIAILVLGALALGLIGTLTPRNADTVGFLQLLYSTHKTIGVTVLALAVVRVIWALVQPRPVPLHPERRLQTFAAHTAHWLLYAAILVMPVSGWVMHSAEVGFAPIWWPLGQDLPFVPKSETLAAAAATLHATAAIVLALTVAAHIGGALKHALIDRDGTLARMIRGTRAGDATSRHVKPVAAALVAVAVWGLAIGGAVAVSAPAPGVANQDAAAPVSDTSGWAVQDGTISITIVQIGAQVTGRFDTWQATIDYDPETGTGQVEAVIDTTSLTLGSVSDQAKGPEFFDVANHAQAVFEGAILRTDAAAHTATGTLTLVGQVVPVTLTFDLAISEGMATMSGVTTLDRRDFAMGAAYADESSVGFAVQVSVALTARQAD